MSGHEARTYFSDRERTLSSDDANETGPLVERVKGTVKQVAGAVTGNDDLKREGELHHDKADAVTEAAALEAHAEQEQTAADITGKEREIEIEQERLAAEAAAETRAEQVEAERIAENQRIADDTQRAEAATESHAAAQQAAATRSERHAAAKHAAAEAHAD
jgi:uncharacterized protein YjbJ (UPF0337 family)